MEHFILIQKSMKIIRADAGIQTGLQSITTIGELVIRFST